LDMLDPSDLGLKDAGVRAWSEYMAGFKLAATGFDLEQWVKDNITNPVIETVDDEYEIRSPSKVAMRQGRDYIKGLQLGFNQGANELVIPSQILSGFDRMFAQSASPMGPTSTTTHGPTIQINHPNHPTDDLSRDLQRASILAGFQGIAETVGIKN
jgi:hypothetical protein